MFPFSFFTQEPNVFVVRLFVQGSWHCCPASWSLTLDSWNRTPLPPFQDQKEGCRVRMACGSVAWNKEEPKTARVKIGLGNKGTMWSNLRGKEQELEPKKTTMKEGSGKHSNKEHSQLRLLEDHDSQPGLQLESSPGDLLTCYHLWRTVDGLRFYSICKSFYFQLACLAFMGAGRR